MQHVQGNNHKAKTEQKSKHSADFTDTALFRLLHIPRGSKYTLKCDIKSKSGACVFICRPNHNAHLTVGKLVPDKPSNPYLSCQKTLGKVNIQYVAYVIKRGMNIFYPGEVDDTKILLLYTDAASCITNYLHVLTTSGQKHVTHLAHRLNRFAKQMRNEFTKVNNCLVSYTSKVFCKIPSRAAASKANFQSLPHTPACLDQPRRCTRLKAAQHYCKSLEAVAETVQAFPDTDYALCEALVRETVNDVNVKKRF
jgi:hypothetical protein